MTIINTVIITVTVTVIIIIVNIVTISRDEIEAAEAARLTVKLDGDVIMGEIIAESRAQVVS